MAWNSIKELVGAVPITERSERAEVVALPNKAIGTLYQSIMQMRAQIESMDGDIGALVQEWEAYERTAKERIERIQSDKLKLLRALTDRQDDWRKVSADLGVACIWPDTEVENVDDITAGARDRRNTADRGG